MLVVAGAGSGKTETMAARVVHLVANGLVAPGEILGLTFTRKAAAELSGRIRVRLRALARVGVNGGDAVEDRPRIATYNSYASAIVRDHALRIGVDPDATLIGDAGRYQLAEQIVTAWSGDIETGLAPTTIIDAVAALSAELSEHGLEPGEAAAAIDRIAGALADKEATGRNRAPMAQVLKVIGSLGTRGQLMDLVGAFAQRKQRDGVVDFGDQVRLAATIAASVPEVGEAERSRYRVVLLDEYQDTSIAQVQMLRALFAGGHPVTAVGDPNQAIYGWRGAAAGTLFAFPAAFSDGAGEPARIAHLSTAWRNDVAILTAANRTAGPLRELASVGGAVRELRARPGAGPGRAVAAFCETAPEEAARIADLLADTWHPEQASAAVLCRKRAQFPVIEAALRAAGLPCQVVGLAGLLSTPEVSDIRAALQVAHDPSRGDAMMRLLTGGSVNVGAADLYALSRWARSQASTWVARSDDDADEVPVVLEAAEQASLVEAVDVLPPPSWRTADGRSLSDGARRRLARLSGQIRQIRSLTYLSMPELVTAAETILDLDIEVLASVPGSVGHARRHLDAFTSAAASFAGDSDSPTLGAFLTYLDVAEDEERGLEVIEAEPDPTAIQIMTVHAAKGLEWDTVVVAGLNEGSFPSIPSRNGWLTAVASLPYELRGDTDWLPELDIEGPTTHKEMDLAVAEFKEAEGERLLAEERRLAYVALTRAKRTLMLSGSFWTADRKTPTAPSVFLLELVRAGLVETDGEWPAASAYESNPGTGAQAQGYWPREQETGAVIADRWEQIWADADAVSSDGPDAPVTTSGAGWWRDARLLLAEREAAGHTQVPPPEHLSASAVVSLAADAEEFIRNRRRPIPHQPSVAARRGTRFHAWVEQYFGASSLIEMDALPGADDEPGAADRALADLQQAFLGSPWATRTPLAVEVDIETPVAGITIRCRIDAVFGETDGGVHIVDWKTGTAPRSPEALRARQLQLALYRIAWSRLHDVPLGRVRASFHYVAESVTVGGADLSEWEVEEVLAQVGPETVLSARPRARVDRSDRARRPQVEIVADTLW
ncbi:ATP-dependent helicase [Occultella glacieicola]|uniref:DNA 3'-5' helicase n=2 Tax=Occultella glacieicola TaxID=2518684 RepID=A0ABY2E7Y2_9MICO|nr:ATP-dependent helicase [Occultella glacieicola]